MTTGNEIVQFSNFRVGKDSVYQIGAIPETDNAPARPSVIDETKVAFDYDGENLGELIGIVAPHRTLQDNINFAHEKLSDPAVKQKLGYEDKTALEIAHQWGERSGLQAEVFRPFMQTSEELPDSFAAAVIFDGVVNWMNRMAGVAESAARKVNTERLILASASREIDPSEHPDVPGGTKANHFMADLSSKFVTTGLFNVIELVSTTKKDGNSVMARAAGHLALGEDIDLSRAQIFIPTVAGNWMQKGAQFRQALQRVNPDFDSDPENRQLWVASDSFPLGITGEEPKTTHQNPLSAIGNILRGAKLMAEQH